MIKYSFWHFNFWPRLLLRNYLMAIFIYLQYITSWLVGGYYWHLFSIFKQLICPKGWRSLDFEYNWNWNVWSLLDMEGCGIKSTLGISYWDWVANDKFYSMILVLGNSYYYNLVVTMIWVFTFYTEFLGLLQYFIWQGSLSHCQLSLSISTISECY